MKLSLHIMKLSPQNSFGGSHSQRPVRRKAPKQLNALRALPVYPVSEEEKLVAPGEKSVKRKSF